MSDPADFSPVPPGPLDRSSAISGPQPALVCLFCGGHLPANHVGQPCPHCGCTRPTAPLTELPLLGRSRELDLLRGAVDRLADGRGAMIGLAGAPGIGKTRLLEAVLGHVKAGKLSDFVLRGFEPVADLPYWSLVEALQSTTTAPGAPGAAEIAQLVLALRAARETPVHATAGFETRDAGVNAQVYETVAGVLRSITAIRPLVILADDLQWFDVPTLNLMRYAVRLARTLPILFVCTYRDQEEGAARHRPLLEDATREGLFRELRLEGLETAAARGLALAAAPEPLSDRAVSEVLRLAEGNPFYITQIARAVGLAAPLDGRAPLPAALRGFVEQRLSGLSRPCRALVQAVAVVGRDCPLDLMATLFSEGDADLTSLRGLAAALDEALTAHVLREVEGAGRPQYGFTHALLGEAALREQNSLSRARLHLRTAEALEGRRAGGHAIPAGEIAEHYLAARPLAPVEPALNLLREAAEEAFVLGAFEQAGRFLAAVVDLLGESGAPEADVIAVRTRLLEVYGAIGDIDALERDAGSVLAYYAGHGDHEGEARTRALIAEALDPRRRPRDVVAHADAALALLGDVRTPLTARLRFLRAHAHAMRDQDADLLGVANWLEAGPFDPPEPAAAVWSRLLRVLWQIAQSSDAAQVMALCRESVEHTRAAGDRRAQAMTLLWLAEVLNRDARPAEALEALDAARILAAESGSASMLVDAGALRCEALLQLARWEELEETVDRTLPVLIRLRATYFGYTLVAAHAWSRRLRGLPWTAPAGLEIRFHDSLAFVAAYRANHAREQIETLAGDRPDERTERLLDWLVANVARGGPGLSWATAGLPAFSALTIAGRVDDAAARFDDAARFPRFLQYGTFAPLELGRAAVLLKRWNMAETYFDAATSMAMAGGLRTALARTLVARGAMYRRRGRRGDRARAAEVLRRAVQVCAEIGLLPDRDRALALLQGLEENPAHAPAGLTRREVEVLRLLTAGRTNRQIGDDLSISEKTVEQHLLNIYQKLNVDSRAKAVAFAFANGLTD